MLIDLEVSAAASNVLPPNLCLASLFGLLLSSLFKETYKRKVCVVNRKLDIVVLMIFLFILT